MPAQPLQPSDPRRLGSVMLVGRLGEGGQGIVYLGLDGDGRQVAVKVLKTGADENARERLAGEIAAAMRVRAFCTARVLDSSVDAPQPYIVSEFVDGPSLQERVEQRGPLADGDLERLIVNTATALTAIHSARIVHRDLKPGNVLLGPDGPRVVDFGISRPADKRTSTGQLIGTPAYFSPEQLSHRPATPASDVFAWAGTMVFAATGRPPFGQDDITAVFGAILRDPPDLAGVPGQLRDLLARCLDKDPERRPTAKELLGLLLDSDSGVGHPEAVDPQVTRAAEDLLLSVPEAAAPAASPPAPPEPAGAAPPAGAAEQQAAPEARRPGGSMPPVVRAHETITPGRAALGTNPGASAPRPEGRPPGEPVVGGPAVPGAVAGAFPPGPRPPLAPGDDRSHEGGGRGSGGRGAWPGDGTVPGARPDGHTRRRRHVAAPLVIAAVVLAALGGLAAVRFLSRGSGESIPASYGGTWTGSVLQGDGITSRSFDATVTLDAGTGSGRLELPGAGCSGRLTLTDANPSGLRLKLAIVSGDCPEGVVSVYLNGGALMYDLAGPGSMGAHGSLHRSG